MRNKKQFTAFGVEYRTEQFAASTGMELMASKVEIHPLEILSLTEVRTGDGRWLSLSIRDNVNLHVFDAAGIIPPRLVLEGILSVVREFNFGFLADWKSTRIPARFTSESISLSSKYTDPIMAQLINDDVASMRELEEYYSLEDAFKMFDLLVVKGINQATANEEASKKTSRR
jgi:hypothetical protein